MAQSYRERYDEFFWSAFRESISSNQRNILAEFGCGPGLFLSDAVDYFNPSFVYGFDASQEMLDFAKQSLSSKLSEDRISLEQIDFDRKDIPIDDEIIDFAFSGFFLHEVEHPVSHIRDVFTCLNSSGVYAVYDFISGNKDAFIQAMVKRGMPSERAEARYPHMCRHSIDDIVLLFEGSGYDAKPIKIDEFRALVVGTK
jgi:ubiquinone/menaquinone biosynthesis C-methylase UbiE